VELSTRYITGRYQPDKAIDVIDEAGAKLHLRSMTRPPDLKELEEERKRLNRQKEEAVAAEDFEKAAALRNEVDQVTENMETIREKWRESTREACGEVDSEDIAEVVSKMTGVPLTRLETAEAERLLQMEEEIHKRVVSQDEAIQAIARAVRRSRSGLKDPRRPVGSFIFLGPTGVGKTLLARALAQFMFGEEEALIQIDMSEYMEKHNVSRLIGAPPGYVGYEEGGQLTEKIRHRPYAVVLLDEIEKAHPDVFNMLLQIMEDGRLTDSFGRGVDFCNVIMIMTSNIGAELIKGQTSLGFRQTSEEFTYQNMKERLLREVDRHFRPEFLNRVDDVIVFKPLTKENLQEIVEIEMEEVRSRLADKGISLILSPEAKDFLIERGYEPDFGARPLRRAIENLVEDPLSEEILRGRFKGKKVIRIGFKEGHLTFEAVEDEAGVPAPVSQGEDA